MCGSNLKFEANHGGLAFVFYIGLYISIVLITIFSITQEMTLTLLTFPQEWFLRSDVRFIISFEDVYSNNTPTIEWLEKVQRIYPDQKLVWYTGADSVMPKPEYENLSEIEAKWVRGKELFEKWNFLVFPRIGFADPKTLSLPSNFEVAEAELPEVSS